MTAHVVRHAYDGTRVSDSDIDCSGDEVRTKQEFREECDVNRIVRQYAQIGTLPAASGSPVYGDVSDVGDYLSAQLLIKRAESRFAALASAVRDRFANDPAKFLAFMGDEKNKDEAVKLGLIEAEPVVVEKVQKVEVVNSPPVVK